MLYIYILYNTVYYCVVGIYRYKLLNAFSPSVIIFLWSHFSWVPIHTNLPRHMAQAPSLSCANRARVLWHMRVALTFHGMQINTNDNVGSVYRYLASATCCQPIDRSCTRMRLIWSELTWSTVRFSSRLEVSSFLHKQGAGGVETGSLGRKHLEKTRGGVGGSIFKVPNYVGITEDGPVFSTGI